MSLFYCYALKAVFLSCVSSDDPTCPAYPGLPWGLPGMYR